MVLTVTLTAGPNGGGRSRGSATVTCCGDGVQYRLGVYGRGKYIMELHDRPRQ
jgi:hypothetical protein